MKPIVLQNSPYFTRFNAGPHINSVYICTYAWLHNTQYVASTKLWSVIFHILFLCVFRNEFQHRKSTTCITSFLYDGISSDYSIEDIIHKIRAGINPIYNGYRNFEKKRKLAQQNTTISIGN